MRFRQPKRKLRSRNISWKSASGWYGRHLHPWVTFIVFKSCNSAVGPKVTPMEKRIKKYFREWRRKKIEWLSLKEAFIGTDDCGKRNFNFRWLLLFQWHSVGSCVHRLPGLILKSAAVSVQLISGICWYYMQERTPFFLSASIFFAQCFISLYRISVKYSVNSNRETRWLPYVFRRSNSIDLSPAIPLPWKLFLMSFHFSLVRTKISAPYYRELVKPLRI